MSVRIIFLRTIYFSLFKLGIWAKRKKNVIQKLIRKTIRKSNLSDLFEFVRKFLLIKLIDRSLINKYRLISGWLNTRFPGRLWLNQYDLTYRTCLCELVVFGDAIWINFGFGKRYRNSFFQILNFLIELLTVLDHKHKWLLWNLAKFTPHFLFSSFFFELFWNLITLFIFKLKINQNGQFIKTYPYSLHHLFISLKF